MIKTYLSDFKPGQAQARFNCRTTENGSSLEISDLESRDYTFYVFSENKGVDQL